jgi:hypothetical protein
MSSYREPRGFKQNWTAGQMVDVGFLRLRVIETNDDGSFTLVNADLSKMYNFAPFKGLTRIHEGE